MRAPTSWLRSYCDPQLSAEELADELAMHSIEVERIDHIGAPSSDSFVVGKVLSVEKHPDADKLSVCEVDAGDGRRTIVCGAPNVAAGQTVPVALPGAVMPDGTKARQGQAARRRVRRHDPLGGRARDRRGLRRDRRPRRGRRRTRDASRRADSGVGFGDRAGTDVQPGGLLRHLRDRARGSRNHRDGAGVGPVGRGRGGQRRGRGRPTTPR